MAKQLWHNLPKTHQNLLSTHTRLAKHSKTCHFSQVTPSDIIQTPYSREPADSDTLWRGMGGLERNPGTTRRPQRSTGDPARLQSRAGCLGGAGTAVWLGLTFEQPTMAPVPYPHGVRHPRHQPYQSAVLSAPPANPRYLPVLQGFARVY